MKIVVVEDHILFLEGVVDFLKKELKQEPSVYGFHNSLEAKTFLEYDNNVDVLITDLNIPKLNGMSLIKIARQQNSNLKIIVLTMYFSKSLIEKLEEMKIDGYLTKNVSRDEVLMAVKEVTSGEKYISPEIDSLFKEYDFSYMYEDTVEDGFMKLFSLSKRELHILQQMLENKTNTEIAELSFISTETVKSHRKNIYRKLGVNNILDLYKLVVSKGLIKQ